MSNPQPPPELTTRDVLQQVDHRLGLIETDVRELSSKVETKFDAHEFKFDGKINELRRVFNGKFNLPIGLILTSWLSMMGTLLFKLP